MVEITVVACKIDETKFYYKCPAKKCKKIHSHGSCGELENRTESRISHCRECEGVVKIIIDDSTTRVKRKNKK